MPVDGRSSTGKTGHSRNVGVALTSFDQLFKGATWLVATWFAYQRGSLGQMSWHLSVRSVDVAVT